mgnify:CR=1 FL=1
MLVAGHFMGSLNATLKSTTIIELSLYRLLVMNDLRGYDTETNFVSRCKQCCE